jgi:Protein of unknown function (DUF3179)
MVASTKTEMKKPILNPVAGWLILIALFASAVAMVAIPVYLIAPFKGQTAQGMEISYILKRWSPTVTLAFAVIGAAVAAYLWRGSRRWWKRAALVAFVLVTIVAAWFARQNHFEWMFNPLPVASYAKVSDTTFVEDDDQVLAIKINGDAAAYPIRQMAYHHIVQDEVGGVPVVATY